MSGVKLERGRTRKTRKGKSPLRFPFLPFFYFDASHAMQAIGRGWGGGGVASRPDV